VESVEDAFPLNAAHRGILFHSLQNETLDVYLSVIKLRIQGVLDTALLQQAWQHVFSHHPCLRSAVVFDGLDEPLWVVHDSIDPDWKFLDFTSYTPTECVNRERDVIDRLAHTRFKFAAEALMKFILIKLDDNTHQLLWVVHHILSDGWSTAVVLEDVATAYAACVRGDTPSLPPALAYRRFLDNQSKVDPNPLKRYWSEYLQGRSPTPLMFIDTVHDVSTVGRSVVETQLEIDENQSRAVIEAARRFKTTSNVLLVAVCESSVH